MKTLSKIRYYYHGDKADRPSDSYYCAICDLFKPKAHFSNDQTHLDQNLRKFSEMLLLGSKDGAFFKKGYFRAEEATNLFSSKFKKLTNRKPFPFYTWLISQITRDDIISDLAYDAKHDSNFPKFSKAKKDYFKYLNSKGADPEALVALQEGWIEYSKSKKNRRLPISLKLRFEILKRDGYFCQICGSKATNDNQLEIDHRLPVSEGGTNEISNLWTLCFCCNRGKGTRKL